MRGALAALALIAAAPVCAAAQQTPEGVAVAYFEHFKEGRLQEFTALVHPRALESFKTAIVASLEADTSAAADGLDVEVLRTLPADSVYLRILTAAPEENRLAVLMTEMRMEPLGHLAQGDSVAHVVYVGRGSIMGAEAAQTMAMTLRRHGDRWLVDPGDGLLGMLGSSAMYLLLAASMEGQFGGGARPRP
jgi:hypothetical protein